MTVLSSAGHRTNRNLALESVVVMSREPTDPMRRPFFLMMAFFLTACNAPEDGTSATAGGDGDRSTARTSWARPVASARGRALFERHCAVCHGADAQGAVGWRRRDAQGFWPPPPLDGSGHAWHHSRRALIDKVRFGAAPGEGRMPGFGGRLDREEIEMVVDWVQSRWPSEIYHRWLRRQMADGVTR